MRTASITTRSRNLGFAWSNRPRQFHNADGSSYLGIPSPTKPEDVGGIAAIERALRSAARQNNGGNYWSASLFVGRRRVLQYNGVPVGVDLIRQILRDVREEAEAARQGHAALTVEVEVED